ncbi:MAG: outer membrane lipoprotein carrier protein LolA [Terriglobales bacterium]|jgi:outer membrane lipoprotein-sorting protein
MRVAASKLFLGTVVVAWLFTGWLFTASAWAQMVGESSDLERVLGQMDAAARNFKAIEASVIWDHYDNVIKETETEKGKIYFRRDGGEVQMAVDFADPEKYVRYRSGKVQVYLPKMDEVDEYNPGKNRADVESYLVLGFGGSGHDLFKSYDVRFVGMEDANGVKAEKLELIPKSDRLRNDFVARIFLWIDPARGISVQQQFFEPGGNYRLVKYSDIQPEAKLPDDVFKLKTTKKTKFVSPQGQG